MSNLQLNGFAVVFQFGICSFLFHTTEFHVVHI
jgi:hypothetical protein